jgi:hypothetical protein
MNSRNMPTETNPKLQSSILTHPLIFHFLGMPASFLIAGYLSNFHSGYIQFIFLCLFFQVSCGLINYFVLREVFEQFRSSRPENLTSLAVLIVVGALAVSSLVISSQFPGLFDQRLIVMDMSLLRVFLGTMVLSTPVVLWAVALIEKKGLFRFIENAGITRFIQKNRAGIFLTLLFFLTYFIFTQSLNFPGYFTRDRYFETDISDWIDRLTAHPTANEIRPVRAVHPAVMLILHPLTRLLSIPLNGDKLQAAFLLSALAGSGCVFLTWLIVKQRTGSTPYALISASLLGAGASHLLLSTMLESYIFSALALISFCFLLQSGRISLKSTVPVGVVIFGITITNLAQALILYFLKLPRVKVMIQFVFAVVLTTLLLNILQVRLYSYSKPLYDLSNLLEEQKYRSDLSETPRRSMERINLIARAVLLYGIAAPSP